MNLKISHKLRKLIMFVKGFKRKGKQRFLKWGNAGSNGVCLKKGGGGGGWVWNPFTNYV